MKYIQKTTIENGLDRIDQIKREIASCKPPRVCKAEVYEMWEEASNPDEG